MTRIRQFLAFASDMGHTQSLDVYKNKEGRARLPRCAPARTLFA
jgi:hypothetical protein